MKKLFAMVMMAALLLPATALADNTTVTKGDVEDTTIPSLEVVSPSEYFQVTSSNVEQTEKGYRVTGAVKLDMPSSANPTAIRQVILGWDGTEKPVKCVYNGITLNDPKKINFDITLDKGQVDNIKKNGQATLIATKHAGWSCGWSLKRWKDEKGIKVQTFSDVKSMSSVVVPIVLVIVGFAGYIIYKKMS